MSESDGLSGIALPAQSAPSERSFDARSGSIEAWIASLPMANLGETSRRVFTALVETNRLELPAEQRFTAAELMGRPAHYVSESLKKHFVGSPFPLPERNRKIAELARALLLETAIAYKLVTRDLLRQSARPDPKILLTAVHRTMRYLGLVLLRSYQVYAPYPKGVWNEIHRLYTFAEQNALAGNKVRDPQDSAPGDTSISEEYKRILLLALASPYRLRQQEVEQTYCALKPVAGLARISAATGDEKQQVLFLVRLDSDNPPNYAELNRQSDATSLRQLDVSDLAGQLRRGALASLPEDLLRRLNDSWSTVAKRGFSRSRREGKVEVVVGLSAAHYFISGRSPSPITTPDRSASATDGETGNQPVLSQRAQYSSAAVAGEGDAKLGPDIWDITFTYAGQGRDANEVPDTETAFDSPAEGVQQYHIRQLDVSNLSASGYCLLCDTESNCSAQVGDLIAVREPDKANINQWGIGLIRRMSSLENDDLEIGIELLTPNAVAVATRPIRDESPAGEYMRSLMLPELRAVNQPATLIAPALPFQAGDEIIMNIHGKDIKIRLTRALETTGTVTQFEFTALEPLEELGEVPVDDRPDRGFDSLWSSL